VKKEVIKLLEPTLYIQSQIVNGLRDTLISAPILQPPDWNLPLEIMCDASDYAVGAVLGQKKDKKLYAIYYASKTLGVT
jgi:RNase H-like domain found in reverse transcriptase